MWKRRLAAMLMVGRKTKVLMVGRRSLATSEPMGASQAGGSRGEGLCELDGDDGENSRGERALKFKCPAWPGGLRAGNSCCRHSRPLCFCLSPRAKFLMQPAAAGGRCFVLLISPWVFLKERRGTLSLHALCWVLDLGAMWVRATGLLAPHGDTPPLHPTPAPSLGQCFWNSLAGKNYLLLHTGTK